MSRKGYKMTEEHKAALSAARKGFKMSDETRANISAALKGRKNPKVSAANKGKKRSAEHRANYSAALRASEAHYEAVYKVCTTERTCPHCAHIGDGPVMYRWHFDNCKYKRQL